MGSSVFNASVVNIFVYLKIKLASIPTNSAVYSLLLLFYKGYLRYDHVNIVLMRSSPLIG